MKQLVCLDTHILIWGIKGEVTPGQEEMVEIAQAFIQHLYSEKIKAMIPAVVVAELLMKATDENQRLELINLFNKKFRVAPFDSMAAFRFSEIWQKNHENKSEEDTRDKVKFDCQIVSIAVANQAKCIYTYDNGLSKFAKGFIQTEKMPDLRETQKKLLFLES